MVGMIFQTRSRTIRSISSTPSKLSARQTVINVSFIYRICLIRSDLFDICSVVIKYNISTAMSQPNSNTLQNKRMNENKDTFL